MKLPVNLPLVVLLGALLAGPVCSQTYPARALRIVVPSSSGSGADYSARLISQPLSDRLGQQVVVENRAGAATMIGTEIVAKSAPDGYTLLLGVGTLATVPAMYKKVPYDALRDLAPITQLASVANILVVHPSLPAKSVKELVALAKARPGEIAFASSGTGTLPHLSMELFLVMTGTKMLHVPYKGPGPGLFDLLSGRVSAMTTSTTAAFPHVRSGRLRVLGVTTAKRIPAVMPDVPTIAEAGVPGYESVQWWGLLVPAGTPGDIIARLHKEVVSVMSTTGHQGALREGGDGGHRRIAAGIRSLHPRRDGKVGEDSQARRYNSRSSAPRRGAGIGGTRSRGPIYGDATVEPIMGASFLPIPLRVSGVRSPEGPSSARRRAPVCGDATAGGAQGGRHDDHGGIQDVVAEAARQEELMRSMKDLRARRRSRHPSRRRGARAGAVDSPYCGGRLRISTM